MEYSTHHPTPTEACIYKAPGPFLASRPNLGCEFIRPALKILLAVVSEHGDCGRSYPQEESLSSINTKYLQPPSLSPATISIGAAGAAAGAAFTFTCGLTHPPPPTIQMSGWLTRVGASAPLTMRAAMSQVPFPSLIIAQLDPGAVLGGWHISQGMQNPEYACDMWLYEVEVAGAISYLWVHPDGTILESIAASTGPSPTALATQEDGNKQRGYSIGVGGEGGSGHAPPEIG